MTGNVAISFYCPGIPSSSCSMICLITAEIGAPFASMLRACCRIRAKAILHQNIAAFSGSGALYVDVRRQDFGLCNSLFAKDKFCLIRRGRLVLAQRRARSGSDRALPGAGAAILRGSCPLGAGHEAAAVDRAPATGRPSSGTTAVGQGLSGASAGRRRARRPAGSSARSIGPCGGEPSCK